MRNLLTHCSDIIDYVMTIKIYEIEHMLKHTMVCTIPQKLGTKSKTKYKSLIPVIGEAILIFVISIVKNNDQIKPIRAKYRIKVLRNLDPTAWTKFDCFAPVMSYLEFRLIMALQCQLKTSPQQGDLFRYFANPPFP